MGSWWKVIYNEIFYYLLYSYTNLIFAGPFPEVKKKLMLAIGKSLERSAAKTNIQKLQFWI